MSIRVNRTVLDLVEGDLTEQDTDAIVNAANKSLLGGGGVDGAIHRAAGPALLAECRTLGGCNTGEAKMTRGYDLSATHVIHTVGPVYSGSPRDAELLANCYRNSLRLARDHNLRSVALPAISCGVYGYPVGEAAGVALDTVLEFLSENAVPEKVIFALFSPEHLQAYTRALEARSEGDP